MSGGGEQMVYRWGGRHSDSYNCVSECASCLMAKKVSRPQLSGLQAGIRIEISKSSEATKFGRAKMTMCSCEHVQIVHFSIL